MPLQYWRSGAYSYYIIIFILYHIITLYQIFSCSLVTFAILKQALRNRLTWMLHRFNEIIPLGSGMEIYLCWCLQIITGSYSKHSSPSTFWPYLRNIAFLTGSTEKINWSSILRIQSTYHSCKPKNTHLLNDPALYFIVIKCGKRSHKPHTSSTTAQFRRSFPKEQDILFIINILIP